MRVDKYLWSIRFFKTRSIATKACKNNEVSIQDQPVKPSRELKLEEEIQVKKNSIFYKVKVLDFPKGRVGAKLVADYALDITPEEQLERLKMLNTKLKYERPKGEGRPTKKDRRELDNFTAQWDDWDD